MDGKDMQQQTEPQEDGFLDGWEETGPEMEAEAPAVDGEVQTETQQEEQEKGGTDAGAAQAVGTTGGSGGLNGGTAQPGDGGPGGEGAPPAGGSGQPGGQPNGQQPPPPPPPVPKTWTLNHMGQSVTISEADVPVLAQKAMDYDRVRASYDEARPVMDLFRDFARQAGISVQEYVGRLRAQAKQAQGMDEAEARRVMELEDREARMNAQEEADRARQEAARRAQVARAQRQERINADIQEFISVFPNAARDFQNIPREVWDAVNGGMSLVAAYARYTSTQAAENARVQAEEAARQEAVRAQNARNAAASTGSMKSAGNNNGPKDPFLEGWDE